MNFYPIISYLDPMNFTPSVRVSIMDFSIDRVSAVAELYAEGNSRVIGGLFTVEG